MAGANGEQEASGSEAVGYMLAVLQAVFYSTLGIFGKLLYGTGLDAQQAVILRFLAATIILGLFLIVRRQQLVSRQPAVYVQAVFFFLSALFYFLAVEKLTAGLTTVLFYLYPAIVAVASVFVFKERLTALTLVALALALAGLVLVSGIVAGGVVLDPVGIAFGVVSCTSFAVYTLLIQKTARTEGAFTVTFTLSLTSLVASCIVFAPSVPSMFQLTPHQMMLGALMAMICTILPIVAYIAAIKRIGGTKASLISISETPFSLALAYLLLGETLTLQQGVGSILIIASILLITISPLLTKRKPNA